MKKRLLAGLLALCMLVSLFGCMGLSADAKAYNAAVEQLEAKGSVTLDIVQKSVTEVNGSSATLTVEQELTYNGLDTKVPTVKLVEKFPDSSVDWPYTEHYVGQVLYAMYGDGLFIDAFGKTQTDNRYVPVGLFSAKRYRKVVSFPDGEGTCIRFENPKSAEKWALPAGAKLVEAVGLAKLDKDGALGEMTYRVVYQYGNAKTTLEVISTPRKEAEKVELPFDASKYTQLEYFDAPRDVAYATARAARMKNTFVSNSQFTLVPSSIESGVKSYERYLSEKDGRPIFRIDTTIQEYDGTTTQSQAKYLDGVLTQTPSKSYTMTDDEAVEAFSKASAPVTARPMYWKDVTVTDLGQVLLLEFTLSEEWGKSLEKDFRTTILDYQVQEMVAYMSVDKTTGVSVGSGYKFVGSGVTYGVNGFGHKPGELCKQVTRSVEFPAPGAYKAITGEDLPEKEPEKKPTPLFYKVTGKNGQEMWLLGTIHIGDERTGYLPKEIKDALAASDALALEMDTEKFQKDLETDPYLQQQIRDAYNYTDGSKTADHLSKVYYDAALKYMKASGNYTYGIESLKVAIWENTISNFNLQLGCTLTSDKGVETRLTAWAQELNKPIREVESGLFQMKMLTGWSDELQEFLLMNTMSTTAQAMGQSTQQLYEQWCAGNEKALRKSVGQSGKPNFLQKLFLKDYLPLLEEYNKGMNYDRNAGMLKVAKGYLESGETVFFAVGLAHLLDSENGLVDALKDAGYTVERVQYAK